MDPFVLSASIASIILKKSIEEASRNLSGSTFETLSSLRKQILSRLQSKPDINAALTLAEDSAPESLPKQSMEIVINSLEGEIKKDPDFARELQEHLQKFFDNINHENPEVAEEIEATVKDVLRNIQDDLRNLRNQIEAISVNTSNADFIGRDNALFAGVPTVYNQQFNIYHGSIDDQNNSDFNSEAYSDTTKAKNHLERKLQRSENVSSYSRSLDEDVKDIIEQISRTRGAITKLIPLERRIIDLEDLRKPKSILSYNFVVLIIEIISSLSPLLLLSIPGKLSNLEKEKASRKALKNPELRREDLLADKDLLFLQEIEEKLSKAIRNPDLLQLLKRELSRVNDRVNVRIVITNDSFISLLYPASSCRELVANMMSRIGHRELQEEAGMHLSVITGLVSRLNRLFERLNIEKLTNDNELQVNKLNTNNLNSAEFIQMLVESLDEEALTGAIKTIKFVASKNKVQDYTEVTDLNQEKDKGQEFYVLSDEAPAAIGIMTEIEQRRLIVERLVRADHNRQNITITTVIFYISSIIFSTVFLYLKYGSNPNFSIGNDLTKTRLAFFGVPWPVALWSLIGSFAAMIYRFNRQPIYNFTDAIKWMITRPVQGLVLGSAFYLVLASGLFLLTGGASINTSSNLGKVTTEIILVLAFLVGFSDRFADSVFNALVDKYSSKDVTNKEQKDSEQEKNTKY